MDAGRLPLFCDTAMAWRIERAEAQFIAEASEAAHRRRADEAGFVIPVAGGVAGFAEAGSPYNKVTGLGFGGVPGPAAGIRSSGRTPLWARLCRSNWPTLPIPRLVPC